MNQGRIRKQQQEQDEGACSCAPGGRASLRCFFAEALVVIGQRIRGLVAPVLVLPSLLPLTLPHWDSCSSVWWALVGCERLVFGALVCYTR